MTRWLVLSVLMCAPGVSLAQGKATLIDAPLDVKLSRSPAEIQKLQSDFRQLLARSPNLLVPTRSNWKAALTQAGPLECEVRNDCLRQLAVAAGVLYALYASVELDATGQQVLASGRIVTQDGDEVRAPVQVSVPSAGKLNDAAGKALRALLSRLELGTLPATLPHVEVPAVPVVEKPVATAPLPAPPPPPAQEVARTSPTGVGTLRVLAWGTGGVAVLLAATCLGFGIDAAVIRGGLPSDGRFTTGAQGQAQATVNQHATLSLVAGLGAGLFALTSAFLFAAPPPVAVSLSAGPSGGAFSLSGQF